MASSRKRPRTEETRTDDSRAECPFSVKVVDPKEKEQKKKKRRRTGSGADDDPEQKILLQMSPFSPSGKFRTHETMDLHYRVDPAKSWTDMTRYNSFVLNGVKYFSEGFIYVANDTSLERQKATTNNVGLQPTNKSADDWVARILEIRASDEHHVYARVYWMYWPDELPQGTYDGKKAVQGRQPYHGANELIASNHMDIINVVSVTSQATVKQWYEENDDEVQNSMYWRQAFDVRTYELSAVEPVCSCKTPEHPDKIMVGCTSDACKKWMHEQCIKDTALEATYRRLGTDKPHVSAPPVKEEKGEEEDEAKRPLSPTETGVGVSTQQSISVETGGANGTHSNEDNVEVKEPEDEDAPGAPEDRIPETSDEPQSERDRTDSEPANKGGPNGKIILKPKPGRPKRKPEVNGNSSKPWKRLFEVTLKMDIQPPVLEFKDLREGIVGGDKTWQENIMCLVCGSQIN